MNIFDRIFALHRELKIARYPVSRESLEHRLECSPATIKRIIQQMRDYLNAPIEYDRKANGYSYSERNEHGPVYELPGLWFNTAELEAIVSLKALFCNLDSVLSDQQLESLLDRAKTREFESFGPGVIDPKANSSFNQAAARPLDYCNGA